MNISNLSTRFLSGNWSPFIRTMNQSLNAWSGLILGTSVIALTALQGYRWSHSHATLSHQSTGVDFQKIKNKVCKAYAYVFAGFALTATAAAAAHIGGVSRAILQQPLLSIPVFIGSIASLTATLEVNKKNVKTQHTAWMIFNLTMGMTLSPLGFLNQHIVAQAAAISLGLGGMLTATTFLAPDKKFLEWEGPLMTALTTISLVSSIALFFPGSAFAYGVDRVSLYGGLAIFTALFMASTQRLINEAETKDDLTFDPIKSSLGIYLYSLNFFVRIVEIMAEKNQADKLKKPQG
ncbi:MAG: Bax inhibitor-1 family protein [Parachlamydiaceae bacterium]